MARAAVIYPTFARGEVSPLMLGRIDIPQYPSCLQKCRNCWVRPYGLVSRVAGSEYINTTKNNAKARLLKFVFSASDSYIIEVGAGYFRFYNDGGIVIKDGEIYEIENSYTDEQIETLQYVQIDDIIKFAVLPAGSDNSTAKPKELIRNAPDDWVFQDVNFKTTPYLDENITDVTLKPSATTGDITITASKDTFNEGHIGSYWWIGATVTEDDIETQGYVKITGITSPTKASATVQATLSTTSATTRWGEGAWSDYRGYPACIGLYDGRLYYARTPYQPRNVYGSKPYAYETFTPAIDNEDDGAINIQLATNATGDGSDIKWLMGGSYLLCGTYGGEFIIRGTGDGAVTPTDISAKQRTNWGSERVQPVVAGTFVHFIQRNGKKLRQFQYDYYYDAYKAVDVSIFSEHFFTSGIRAMAYQKNTDSILILLNYAGESGNVGRTLSRDPDGSQFGRFYTWAEAMTGLPREIAGEQNPYVFGSTGTDDAGNDYTFNYTPLSHNIQIQGICPEGWHIPNAYDFYDLIASIAEDYDVLVNSIEAVHSNPGGIYLPDNRESAPMTSMTLTTYGTVTSYLRGSRPDVEGGLWDTNNSAVSQGGTVFTYNDISYPMYFPEKIEEIGFNILPAGQFNGEDETNFGKWSYHWTAVLDANNKAYRFTAAYNNCNFSTASHAIDNEAFNVRCVADY